MPRTFIVAFLALLPVACAQLEGGAEQDLRPPFELTADEIRLARELAERDLHIPLDPLSPMDRVVFVKIDLLPDAQAVTSQRQVIVHHYRYRDDVTILTTIDLNRVEVLGAETIAHFPTAFSPEELARAERLARSDERLRPIFEMPQRHLRVEGRPIQFASSHEPLFGRRVVHLLLREGNTYLTSPRVLVDLSAEAVFVD
jgi:hypothetical protein